MNLVISRESSGIDWQYLENLYLRAGLRGRSAAKLARAFANSHSVCFALVGDQLVGAARAISDGEYQAGIYDVVVAPEHQRQGIGKKMIETLLGELKVWRVLLVCDPDKEAFYHQFGFEKMEGVMALFQKQHLYDADAKSDEPEN